MDTWEYKVVEVTMRKPALAEALFNDLGREGWELTTVTPLSASPSVLVFKRRITEGTEPHKAT